MFVSIGHCVLYNKCIGYFRAREATPNSLESEENVSTSEVDSSVSSKFSTYNHPVASQTTENSTHASEYEDAESGVFMLSF